MLFATLAYTVRSVWSDNAFANVSPTSANNAAPQLGAARAAPGAAEMKRRAAALTSSDPSQCMPQQLRERATGLEPVTSSLGSWHSTN
jgi:hypothetical protein